MSLTDYEDLKQEMRDAAPEPIKEQRSSLVRQANNLGDMVDEVIETFTLLHPEAMAEFHDNMELKRANATKHGESLLATKEEKAMEIRSQVWLPSAVIEFIDARGNKQRKYRNLQGVLKSIYASHGFEDFPVAQNKEEFKMLKEFKRNYPIFFIAEEL